MDTGLIVILVCLVLLILAIAALVVLWRRLFSLSRAMTATQERLTRLERGFAPREHKQSLSIQKVASLQPDDHVIQELSQALALKEGVSPAHVEAKPAAIDHSVAERSALIAKLDLQIAAAIEEERGREEGERRSLEAEPTRPLPQWQS